MLVTEAGVLLAAAGNGEPPGSTVVVRHDGTHGLVHYGYWT